MRMNGVMFDVDKRRRAEEVLQQADQRKDEFLAMLAHELRNPMATIRNGLAVLSLTGGPDGLTQQTIGMMNRQVDHLVHMVDDLLDVSRISQGKIELKRKQLDLTALLTSAVEAMRPQYTAHRKELHLKNWPFALFIDGDATRLSQIIANLLTNGLRYTGEHGQVWVSLQAAASEAQLRVADNGIGLSPDQLTAIFDLFVQADTSLARSQGGLGVGLTLVKQLVEQHGGRVEAHSQGLGQGSEFMVYLPLLADTESATPPATVAEAAAVSPAEPQLLVIDDNADAALTLTMLLKLKGYQAHSRLSGPEGIAAAEQLRPAAILCDISMPGMDGYETARRIRQQPWGKGILLIALTGYGQEDDQQKAIEAGFDHHLTKPVDLGRLISLLETVFL